MADGNEVDFVREIECSDTLLRVHQLYIGDVGCVVWDAAIVLCTFLNNSLFFPSSFWKGKKVIELGAGTGAVGLKATLLGGDVTITDLPSCLSLMERNIEENKIILNQNGGKVQAKVLVWGQEELSMFKPVDVILMADLIYYEDSITDLVTTVRSLSNTDTIIVMSYEVRTTGRKEEMISIFFDEMSKYFLSHEVDYNDLDESCRSKDIKIYFFKLKQ